VKIVSVVGARPQFIKVKPIVDELERKRIQHILIHTGQHYDYEMSKVFFDELKLPKPDYNLGIGSFSQGKQTGLMLEKIEKVLLKEKPNIVIVYGDTNSTLAAALAAVKLHIPIAHIESGLRSYRLDMPEEVNRVLTDHASKYLFCPTKTAIKNLAKEGMTKGVYFVGDIMYDVFLEGQKLLSRRKILSKLALKKKEYFLLTIHRQENTDNIRNLRSIFSALRQVKEKIVFPVHPRTKKILRQNNILTKGFNNILLIDPVSYLDMLTLEKHAEKILTDSGGVQKEAYWSGVPCITLRKETEWVETVKCGRSILVGVNQKKIVNAINKFNPKQRQAQYFGSGESASSIVGVFNK
jgi:UDP-GlcNAc3NAcA epimerase